MDSGYWQFDVGESWGFADNFRLLVLGFFHTKKRDKADGVEWDQDTNWDRILCAEYGHVIYLSKKVQIRNFI